MARLARIAVYPFKSLDPVVLDSVRVLRSGGLENDRRFALRDEAGNFINGKRNARVHRLRSDFDPTSQLLKIGIEGTNDFCSFDVHRDRDALEQWLSSYFESPVKLDENAEAGFPDDPETPGPTVISTATLQTVASWYEGMTVEDARLRFRANLEIDGVEPFWEDRLFATPGTVVQFSIGPISLEGTNPCARCVVPSRSPWTGDAVSMFQKVFANRREAELPPWAERKRFDHFYRLAVNTRPVVATLPATIRVGDHLKIERSRPLAALKKG